jgi:hypothetical protein
MVEKSCCEMFKECSYTMYNLIEIFGVVLDNFVLNLESEEGLTDEVLEKRIVRSIMNLTTPKSPSTN